MTNEKNSKLKTTLIDNKYRRLLLLNIVCAVFSCLGFIVIITRLYLRGFGVHFSLLLSSQALVFALMGSIKFLVWKSIDFKRRSFSIAGTAGIIYTINKLTGQRKLIYRYLLETTFSMLISGIFFSFDIQHGFLAFLKLTTPVTIVTYASGFYFVMIFTRQIKKFETMKQHADHIYLGNISQN